MDQARIYRYMGMTKKKRKKKGTTTEEPDGEFYHAAIENGKLSDEKEIEEKVKQKNKVHKKVSSLIKQQKMQQVMGIIKGLDDWKPWGQEARAKVCHVLMFVPVNGRENLFLRCYNVTIAHYRLAAA